MDGDRGYGRHLHGVAVASLRQTPVYDAVGRIAVNKADSNLIAFKDSTPGTDYVYEQSDLDTEVRILQSDLMALQVIRQLNLDKRPEFGGHSDQKQANLVADPLQTDSTAPRLCSLGFVEISASL